MDSTEVAVEDALTVESVGPIVIGVLIALAVGLALQFVGSLSSRRRKAGGGEITPGKLFADTVIRQFTGKPGNFYMLCIGVYFLIFLIRKVPAGLDIKSTVAAAAFTAIGLIYPLVRIVMAAVLGYKVFSGKYRLMRARIRSRDVEGGLRTSARKKYIITFRDNAGDDLYAACVGRFEFDRLDPGGRLWYLAAADRPPKEDDDSAALVPAGKKAKKNPVRDAAVMVFYDGTARLSAELQKKLVEDTAAAEKEKQTEE